MGRARQPPATVHGGPRPCREGLWARRRIARARAEMGIRAHPRRLHHGRLDRTPRRAAITQPGDQHHRRVASARTMNLQASATNLDELIDHTGRPRIRNRRHGRSPHRRQRGNAAADDGPGDCRRREDDPTSRAPRTAGRFHRLDNDGGRRRTVGRSSVAGFTTCPPARPPWPAQRPLRGRAPSSARSARTSATSACAPSRRRRPSTSLDAATTMLQWRPLRSLSSLASGAGVDRVAIDGDDRWTPLRFLFGCIA